MSRRFFLLLLPYALLPFSASALSQKFWVLSWNGPSSFDKLAIGDGSLDFWVDQGCKAAGNQGGIAVEA
jgi:hypothetical protein